MSALTPWFIRIAALTVLLAAPVGASANDSVDVVHAVDDATANALAATIRQSGLTVEPSKLVGGKDKVEFKTVIQAAPAGLHIGQAGVQIKIGKTERVVQVDVTCKPEKSSVLCDAADAAGNKVAFYYNKIEFG